MNKITKTALIDASLTALYIVGVGLFMNFISEKMGNTKDTFLDPIAFIMLFVLSAAVTSYLMFGRPAFWYLDGKKKEAISLVGQTLGIFFAITVVCLLILILMPH